MFINHRYVMKPSIGFSLTDICNEIMLLRTKVFKTMVGLPSCYKSDISYKHQGSIFRHFGA